MTQTDLVRPVRITDPRVIASLDADAPDIGALWELCVFLEWDRAKAVDGIATWLGAPASQRILDCACGSGFPALDLARRGYNVVCSDGSPAMAEHFARNADLLGVELRTEVVRWEDLGARFTDPFDVVMCRGGGSLLYAGTWDDDVAPHRPAIRAALEQFVECLRPGGRFYVDITNAENLTTHEEHRNAYPPLLVGDHQIEFSEVVTPDPDAGVRTWHSWLNIDGRATEFERRSHFVTHDELIAEMAAAGLVGIRRESIPGETYTVFTGRRP